MSGELEELTERLRAVATRLRDEDLEPGQAAELVEESARLAGEAVAALEARGRQA